MHKASLIAIVSCAFGLALPASAQLGQLGLIVAVAFRPEGGGVKLGTTPTTPASSGEWLPKSDSVVGGFYAEYRLPRGLSLEIDALAFPVLYSNPARGASVFQFPILLKAGPHLGRVRPYVVGGPYYSQRSMVGGSNGGVTFGAGMEIKVRTFWRIAPEVRYNEVGPFRSIDNQAVFLLGVGFGRK